MPACLLCFPTSSQATRHDVCESSLLHLVTMTSRRKENETKENESKARSKSRKHASGDPHSQSITPRLQASPPSPSPAHRHVSQSSPDALEPNILHSNKQRQRVSQSKPWPNGDGKKKGKNRKTGHSKSERKKESRTWHLAGLPGPPQNPTQPNRPPAQPDPQDPPSTTNVRRASKTAVCADWAEGNPVSVECGSAPAVADGGEK